MVQVTGKYTRTKEAKYKDFLSKLGVGFLTRQAATASTPTMEITETNGKWKMVTSTTLKSIVLEFELGVEFDEDTPDGRKCKTTVTKDGDTMITMQKAQVKGQKDVKVIRKFTAAGIEVQMICEDVVSDQFFTRN
eukprot:13124.XXX_116274_115813_1 [CDS] Oithona nana genome sequencing.